MDKIVDKFSQLEAYMLRQIASIEEEIDLNNQGKHLISAETYILIQARLGGQKDVLYKCLTAYDNTYNQIKTK